MTAKQSDPQKLATLEQALEMGLTKDEFSAIEKLMGRVPNFTEMCIYSVMWSEHCSYKNSIKWLENIKLMIQNSLSTTKHSAIALTVLSLHTEFKKIH